MRLGERGRPRRSGETGGRCAVVGAVVGAAGVGSAVGAALSRGAAAVVATGVSRRTVTVSAPVSSSRVSGSQSASCSRLVRVAVQVSAWLRVAQVSAVAPVPSKRTPSTNSRPCAADGTRRSREACRYHRPASAVQRPSLLAPPPRAAVPATVSRYVAPRCTLPAVQVDPADAGTVTVSVLSAGPLRAAEDVGAAARSG